MYKYGKKSLANRATLHHDLQRVVDEIIKRRDCSILVGHRTKEDQDDAFRRGLSKLKWPNSTHNKTPSEGMDISPYPINWNDTKSFYHFAGYVLGVADSLGIKLRWGGDWDSDQDLNDQTFMDLVHFELVK